MKISILTLAGLTAAMALLSAAEVPERAEPPAVPRRDPFQMGVAPGEPGEDSGLTRADDRLIPAGIRVRGILRVKGREPVAVIEVPGSPDSYIVKENEVVRIETTTTRQEPGDPAQSREPSPLPQYMRSNPALRDLTVQPPPSSGQPLHRGTPVVFYLYISKIDAMYIEAYPKTRPDAKQIFR